MQIHINFSIRSHNVTAGQLLKMQLNSTCCCRIAFETALKHRGGPSIVFAHSMGNNVFRYFLEWLKLEIAPKAYLHWLDEHIHAYFAVGIYLSESVPTFLTEFIRSSKAHNLFGLCAVDLISGSPFLGSVQMIESTLSGVTFGLPVSEVLFICFFSIYILNVFPILCLLI